MAGSRLRRSIDPVIRLLFLGGLGNGQGKYHRLVPQEVMLWISLFQTAMLRKLSRSADNVEKNLFIRHVQDQTRISEQYEYSSARIKSIYFGEDERCLP